MTTELRARQRLINARKGKRMTQEQLAEAVGITRAYLANIERGKHAPSLRVAFELARVLDGKLEDLFLEDRVRETHNM
ncbi:putative transcriptional regulator [Tumebacillus sp. BK434]|uniref:helix-turn-helix transcriptional regulator n=1 Tax=Tumebacillus sp. BK434 TaxID=2512169 RepID=UPI00104834CE|nr:helix-turn-helix domain-containing protein [Tumebacillus sp. BK434]TCP55387.1 putative transcriptional regulator [Tumebacillus sp. BK434]